MPELAEVPATPPAAESLFGTATPTTEHYVRLLADSGVTRGLIGPREVPRLWDRHVVNSAVLGELIPDGATVLDVGSGAGLPGIPLALARPDLRVTLLEPMARRVAWLDEVVVELGLAITVVRGRAEEKAVRDRLPLFDVVTARAVAPLGRLAEWSIRSVVPGGALLALKGERAEQEAVDEAVSIRRAGGSVERIVKCGIGVAETPTTVVVVRRDTANTDRRAHRQARKTR